MTAVLLLRGSIITLLGVCLLSAWAINASGQETDDGYGRTESSQRTATQSESLVGFPDAPRSATFQRLAIAGGSNMQFFVDLSSVRVVGRTLVRYTLIARSPGGVSNISYEGLDCARDSWHIYGTWSEARNRWVANPQSKWTAVNEGGFTRIHAALDSDYLCKDGRAAGSGDDIVANFKSGLRSWQPATP